MGLWSSIKKAAKKVWRAAKAVVRVVVRAVIEVLNRLTFGLLDLVFGFFAWPRKRLRLHVFILWSETPPVIEGNPAPPIEQVVQDAIEVTKRIYKERFNVDVLPYSKSFIQSSRTQFRTTRSMSPATSALSSPRRGSITPASLRAGTSYRLQGPGP